MFSLIRTKCQYSWLTTNKTRTFPIMKKRNNKMHFARSSWWCKQKLLCRTVLIIHCFKKYNFENSFWGLVKSAEFNNSPILQSEYLWKHKLVLCCSYAVGIHGKCKHVNSIKVWLSLSKKDCFICFSESPLKMMENVFYFHLKISFRSQNTKIFVLTICS